MNLTITTSLATSTLATAEIIFDELLADWQEWSDETFSGECRDAVETLMIGACRGLSHVAGFVWGWFLLQLARTVTTWQIEAVQRFLCMSGLWLRNRAFALIARTQYPEYCWGELAEHHRTECDRLADEIFCFVEERSLK